MKECIQKWVSSLVQNPAVLLLIQSKELHVCFVIKDEKVYVSILNGTVQMGNERQEQLPDVMIKGNHASFEKMLTGKCLLRKLEYQQQISIQAPFRKILLLEALFQLAHSHINSESSKNSLTTIKLV